MDRLKICLPVVLVYIGVFSLFGLARAELLVHENRLTINVQNVPLETVLRDLSRQGTIEVTVLEKQATKGHEVTARFVRLPLAEGLSRILAGWNYGLITMPGSDRIQEIILVSKRTQSNPSSDMPSSYHEVRGMEEARGDAGGGSQMISDVSSEDSNTGQDDELIDFAEEEWEADDEAYPDDMYLDDFPAENDDAFLDE